MVSREELIQMRNMSFDDIDESKVPDIKDIEIDVTQSKSEKIKEVLASGRNPYFIKTGGIMVRIGFASTNRTIEEALESLISVRC